MSKRDLKLIRKGAAWAICFRAIGRLEGEQGKTMAWLRDTDEAFFCKIGAEDQIEALPRADTRNFFGDAFNYAIDEVDRADNQLARLAGADNIYAAKAAFHALIAHHPPARRILLRKAGRIMLRGEDLRVVDDRPAK